MKRIVLNCVKKISLLFLLITCSGYLQAGDTVFVKSPHLPILIDRNDNILFQLRIDGKEKDIFTGLSLQFDQQFKPELIQSVKLYYGGTDDVAHQAELRFAPVNYISRDISGKTLSADPSYSLKLQEQKIVSGKTEFKVNHALFPGVNYFWVSIKMKPGASVLSKVGAKVVSASLNNQNLIINTTSEFPIRRLGVGVRHAGNDGVAAYRIPGLVTSNKGTLLGVYDIRYNNSADLQEYVDIGLSRSTNGGQSWEPMRVIMKFGEYGGLPKAQNGVGDPAILVDKNTGTIWVVAAWTHGMGNGRAWFNSQQGMDINHTAQLVMVKSDDDGKTWSQPINVTSQLKDPSWFFLLQGPGNGITMKDGTLVFATQFIDSTRVPNAGIMYSKDHGKTWKMHHYARTNTTEAQVVEVEPGVLMLNMRDNRGGSRAVSVTRDMGQTWEEHPSSRSALKESVCMASLIKVEAKDNITGKDILLFSNPNTTKGRHSLTIKASLDAGRTWLPEHQLLLDEGAGWGYSCLSMIDKETVGILYEGSVAHMVFQAIPLKDILNGKPIQPQPGDWKLTWEDNFDTDGVIDTAVWCKIPRGRVDWNRNMSDYNPLYDVRNGNLILKGIVNPGLPEDAAPFLTGGIFTKGKKMFYHGKIEIRAKFENAQGAWPAFWLLPFSEENNGAWPYGGEIDIMERLNSDTIAYQTVHSHYTHNLKQTANPKQGTTAPIRADEYNTYGVEMYADSLVFSINGQRTMCYPRIDTDKEGQFPFDRPYYLLLDMQLGGSWVGKVNPDDLPVSMYIDWVRYYKKEE